MIRVSGNFDDIKINTQAMTDFIFSIILLD